MTLTINTRNNSIEMPTKKYAAAASKYGSPEYIEVQNARRDYPNYKVVTRKTTKRHDNLKGLTYKVMKTYIASHDENGELMKKYTFLRGESENSIHSEPYGVIKKWFLETYPNFGKEPQSNAENENSNTNVQ